MARAREFASARAYFLKFMVEVVYAREENRTGMLLWRDARRAVLRCLETAQRPHYPTREAREIRSTMPPTPLYG